MQLTVGIFDLIMGQYLNKNQEEISESLKEEYELQAQPYLLHRRTQQLCTLHKVTANSLEDARKARQIIEEYARSKCESISKLRMHYHVDNTGYCSDEQSFYMVFEGQNNYNLQLEFGNRRTYRSQFSEQEIEQIIETYLCGLREYDHRFQRDYDSLELESLVIDQKSKRIYLRDPWLAPSHTKDHTDAVTSMLLNYPSPQKLDSAYSNRVSEVREFLSNLFSIGVIALELKRLEFADSIYIRKREINAEEVGRRLQEFRGEKLRRGIECLLHSNPQERKKIYQLWGIQNKEQHHLEPILAYPTERKAPNLRSQPHLLLQEHQEWRNPPSQNAFVPSLRSVPSEPIFVPPVSITKHVQTASDPMSSRSNPMATSPFGPNTYSFNFSSPPNPVPPPASNSHQVLHPLPQNYFEFNKFLPSFKQAQTETKGVSFKIAPSFGEDKKLYPVSKQTLPTENAVTFKLPAFPKEPEPAIVPQGNTISSAPYNPLTNFKESFTFYEPYESKLSQDAIRNQSFQTHFDSPPKEREIKSILVEEKKEAGLPKVVEKGDAKVEATSANQENTGSFLANTIKEEIGNNPTIREADDYLDMVMREEAKPDTPVRPTAKNKYNSTIVEVRDEDSPEHSSKSEEVYEEEYVVEEYETGSRYEGFKSNGMRNGRGKFYYQDGGYYEGHWRNNKMDGFGKLYYEGGKLAYEGYWSQDEFNGQGKVYNDNPLYFTNSFDYTNFDLLEDYWEYYEGMLVHDTKEGRGRIKLSNGEVFEGDFHNDRIQGFGKFHTLEGKVVEGIWRESKLIKVINSSSS